MTGKRTYQQGGFWNKNRALYADSVLKANKNLDWVQRLYDKNTPDIQVPGQQYRSTHLMSDNDSGYIFPSVVSRNGQLEYLGDRAEDYARETGTGIQLPREQGNWMARNGYKTAPGVLPNRQYGGYSTEGYKRDSPDRYNRMNTIPGNRITMKGVDIPVYANASNGQQQVMYPGEEHYFPGADYVNEVPLKQQGGYMNNHTGMYWNGKQYRKGNANAAYPGYRDGGHLPMIVPPMYQLWQQGGQVHPQSTHEHWLANRLQTNMNPELAARRSRDSTYAAGQLQENPSYVTAANHMYGQFINQNPTSPDVEALKNRIDAYRAAQATYQQQHKEYGGYTNDQLPMDPGARYNLFKDGGNWIKGAVNPAHKGYMQMGGSMHEYQIGGSYEVDDNEYRRLKSLGYKFRDI